MQGSTLALTNWFSAYRRCSANLDQSTRLAIALAVMCHLLVILILERSPRIIYLHSMATRDIISTNVLFIEMTFLCYS